MLPETSLTNPYLDKDSEIEKSHSRDLPHWNHQGKLQFVTFRLADSLPQSKLSELRMLRKRFEEANPKPKPWSEDIARQYHKLIGPIEDRLLDNGYGNCILRNKNIREILSSTIMYFDKVKYDVMAYVIMPNHVHLLLLVGNNYTLAQCMHSIKSYSSKMINNRMGSNGKIWMKENFDRIIRSEVHLKHCVNYIMENPKHLRQDEYELYCNTEILTAGCGPSI